LFTAIDVSVSVVLLHV